MNQPLEKLHDEAQLLRLSHSEKLMIHTNLIQAMGASTAPATPAPSRGVPGLYYFFSPQMAGAFAALLIVLIGGSAAYAAGAALPGDALYTVKTKINEPVAGALAFS